MPCCVIGTLFILQLMTVVKWFSRVILSKKSQEEDPDRWTPPKGKLQKRLEYILTDTKCRRKLILLFCIEIGLLVVVWKLGGFEFISDGLRMLNGNPEGVMENAQNCHIEK